MTDNATKKPNVLDLARRHAQCMKKIPVPQWTEDPAHPFIVYAKGIRASTFRNCKTLATDGEGFFDEIKFAALVIEKTALDEDGNHLFDKGDHQTLLDEADGDVISGLGRELVAAKRTLYKQSDLEKN